LAALELYEERGYDQATAAQIAERAGVTERTFFRHFPDKREILFGGDAVFCDAVAAAVRNAPAGLGALDMLMFAFQSVEQLFIDNRSFSVPRRRLIASTPALQEREVAKIRKVVATLCEALSERGVESRRAMLAAQVGMAALGQAVEAWMNEESGDLRARIEQSFADVRALSAAEPPLPQRIEAVHKSKRG
jgi:AcrR family transcriptional regulator